MADWSNLQEDLILQIVNNVVYRQVDAEFEMLTIIDNGLSMFKVGDEKLKEIRRSQAPYVQVKLFKGSFYALDLSGGLVMVESGLRIECVANPLPGWNIKCFVESCDRLLLVEACTDNVEHDVECATNRFLWNLEAGKVRFKVYKLVESEKRWELMESLGDQILFLGKNSSFSVSAANVSGCVGNCIYTCSSRFGKLDIHICGETWTQMSDVAVYHLHNDKFKLLTTESEHWKLFSPPPAWTWLSDMEGEYDSSADGYVYIS